MATKDYTDLSNEEHYVMQTLLKRGAGTLDNIFTALPNSLFIPYRTVEACLNNLAQKGYAAYRRNGRKYIYYPIVGSNDMIRIMLEKWEIKPVEHV